MPDEVKWTFPGATAAILPSLRTLCGNDEGKLKTTDNGNGSFDCVCLVPATNAPAGSSSTTAASGADSAPTSSSAIVSSMIAATATPTNFDYNEHLIPLKSGHSISKGWTSWTGHEPKGVTWHWTAGKTIESCRELLGGPDAKRKGEASAHYCVGRSYDEGVDIYVGLENRSWHAGVEQKLRWDGKGSNSHTKGSRSTIGVETVNVGYARSGFPAKSDWIEVADTNCKWVMKVQPWTDEQMNMMIDVGKRIIARWPQIRVRDHHGHHDICPGYKSDVGGFDFARLLRGIYDDDSIFDVWTPLQSVESRQRALIELGYDLGKWADDGHWGDYSAKALEDFQRDSNSTVIGYWTTFTNWAVYDAFEVKGLSLSNLSN
ncbi:N-acetylmuramoyl-L-alanine amidase [Leisingera aquaemixtae]|uniref:N-acetylmuramoyl-L-alanine amidase n=1 Tax=Leisingera aquaemixtae TaxID=1396826 RepID=A0A0N7M4B5_9RHOB|nr:N-acetylmuramoyl-L-alanine amidase [Leisingera aquaemixtae]CUH99170.1 N-acetyl-anhydromuranmyl-L-alanine amidase [Leisingera aquaemixtae]